ncbi:hypothetical protein [Methylosinus sp. KRF6]|uniref:hypothetical protein n=1 Tax=Methylosinus sp. KRF6 TaxID=2846853 RepID=UPI001C0E3D9F|nr:hypothetical protein [Methylosinus sp. KRF6]MBU3888569.1 hypothetical protein [Methylosinus sp. KRF6]
MSQKLSPLDLQIRIAPPSGWAADRPRLSDAELEELAALVEPSFRENGREQFGVYVQNIFAFAVDGLLTQRRYGDSLVVEIRDRLGAFLKDMERAQEAIDRLDIGVRRLLDDELAMFAQVQSAPRHLPTTSIEQWRKATSDLIGVIVAASRRLEITPVKGESGAVWRQMVRGLAALIFATTGVVPRRSVKSAVVGFATTQVDDGWFLRLSRRLAALVFARAEQLGKELRLSPKTLNRPKTKKSNSNPRSGPSIGKATSRRRSESARAALDSETGHPSEKKKTPKRVGPPPLTRIVREELEALERENIE